MRGFGCCARNLGRLKWLNELHFICLLFQYSVLDNLKVFKWRQHKHYIYSEYHTQIRHNIMTSCLLLHVLQMLDQIEIWGIWRLGQQLGPFIVYIEVFLSGVCCVSGHIVLLGGHCHRVVLLWWGGVHSPQQCLDWWCVSSGIQVKSSTQVVPAEHRIMIRWSMLFTSPVSGFNVVADRCIWLWSMNSYKC